MIKSELIATLANGVNVPENEVSQAVNHIIKLLSASLAKGQRIEIRGFGSVDLRILKPRQARNPRTGESIMAPQKRKAHFKAGKDLKDRINLRTGTVKQRTKQLQPETA